ncbi:Protein-export protein SecB [Aquimixticola soesokkakensis]|uniref:Protein-export protein SecB n=1 Tax=Aquimixticola soesokkakensis TaxID=1519096 RepID=A0A1Y5R9Z3_9RHOB|nr:protein-export chaperone SecB [Aquimixticola soesokkakensis]SLN11845.1 Protein-export protein SecB [Aquimixticola soesokkakensis]
MAEASETPSAAPTDAGAAAPVKMQLLAQFIRDMSFENVLFQKGQTPEGKPAIQIQVGLDAKKRAAENQYEVAIKLKINAATENDGPVLYVLELDYVGLFQVENVPEAQLSPFLMIECPRQLFPFLRRIVHDMTRDGGFPPPSLDGIDFVAIYRQNMALRQQQQAAPEATAVN